MRGFLTESAQSLGVRQSGIAVEWRVRGGEAGVAAVVVAGGWTVLAVRSRDGGGRGCGGGSMLRSCTRGEGGRCRSAGVYAVEALGKIDLSVVDGWPSLASCVSADVCGLPGAAAVPMDVGNVLPCLVPAAVCVAVRSDACFAARFFAAHTSFFPFLTGFAIHV